MRGFTFIEVMVAVLLMAIVLFGGTAIFYQNLRSTGLSDIDLNLNTTLRTVLSSMENDIRFSKVLNVGAGDRTDCLLAGDTGFPGSSVTVEDLIGLETVYSLNDGQISSVASQTAREVLITPENISVDELNFTWYCRGNMSDKIKIEIVASSTVLGSGIEVTKDVFREINLLNSGIN